MPVRLCKLSEIEPLENRIRQTLKKDQIEALAQDISTNGLYHPPVLRVNPEDESRFILVAGGRRLAALQYLHAQHIPYTCDGLKIDPITGLCPFNLIKDLGPFQALEIELHENLLRVDLTWKETTAARARLHHLRTAQAEEKEKPRPTILDTAQELAELEQITPVGAANALTRAVHVAPFLNDPEVAKAQSEAQAHRILMKKIEGEFYEKLQNLEEEKIQESAGEDQPVSWGHCLNADFTQLPLPKNHFHLIIADPPYGISADQFGDAAQTSHTYSDTVEIAEDFGYSILEKSYSLATASAHLFMFCDIELHENLLRVDLTWKETTAARARLHHLRTAQAEEKEKPRPTILDTAQELAELEQITPVGAANALTRAVHVAPFLNDPEVAKAQSEAQAHRILMKKIEGEFYEKLQNLEEEKIQESAGEDQPVSWGHCLNADFTQLPLPKNHFHLIIADPPYGISADQFGDAAQTSHTYSDTVEIAEDFGYSILEKSYSLATASAHLFIFCDIELFLKLRYHAKHVGWTPFRTPLVWHHSGQGHVPWMPYSLNTFRREYDLILYCSKGDNGPTALTKLHSDIFQVSKSKKQEHGAQKPDELYYQIMRLCCLPGNNVLDPCCGSGPVFPAAKRALLNPWGVEKNPDTYKLALVSHERAKKGVSL